MPEKVPTTTCEAKVICKAHFHSQQLIVFYRTLERIQTYLSFYNNGSTTRTNSSAQAQSSKSYPFLLSSLEMFFLDSV